MENLIEKLPNIQGEIVIYSDLHINCNEIQQLLKITPTKYQQKGEMIRENLYAKDSGWSYATEVIETFDIEDVTQILINILKGKEEGLCEYLQKNSLNLKIGFVIRPYEEKSFPSIFFSREFIAICNKLNAEIDIDVLW